MPRPLPTGGEAARILAGRRTRPVARPPPTAAKALAPAIKALEARFGQGAASLQARWTEIVGQALARRTEPVKLSQPRARAPMAAGGVSEAPATAKRTTGASRDAATLELRVDGPSATLIQHQAPEILARVNLYLGEGAVARLRIVQGPLRGSSAQSAAGVAAPRQRLKGPLDAADEARLAEGLAAAPEGRLKQALARLGREVLRQEAGAARSPLASEGGAAPKGR